MLSSNAHSLNPFVQGSLRRNRLGYRQPYQTFGWQELRSKSTASGRHSWFGLLRPTAHSNDGRKQMTMLTKCREEIATICKELKIPEFFATFQTQWEKPAYSQMTFEERLLSGTALPPTQTSKPQLEERTLAASAYGTSRTCRLGGKPRIESVDARRALRVRVDQVAHETMGCDPWGYRLWQKLHRKPVGLPGLYARLHSQLLQHGATDH